MALMAKGRNKDMGWFDYYKLLEKYNGNLKKATKAEMEHAFIGNPNDPFTARELAEKKWREEQSKIEEVKAS